VGVLGIWFKKMFGHRLVFETVDLWPDVPIEMGAIKNQFFQKQLYAIENWIYKEAERIVALSEGMAEKIKAKGVLPSKILVAHNGSNCDFFAPSNKKREAKQGLGFSEDTFLVLYAGTIGIANGLEFLVEAVERIEKMGKKDIQFLVIGQGNRREQVVLYAQSKSLPQLTFLENVPKEEVLRYFQAADLGLVLFAPYKILETNSANKFFDYLASGLPVVINYEGWQAEYLSQYACGRSCTTSESMAETIVSLSSEKNPCLEMGQNARNVACSKFDRKMIAQKILTEFKEIYSRP
jgi:glycosyltransferase involved in cell wall biosynthesis